MQLFSTKNKYEEEEKVIIKPELAGLRRCKLCMEKFIPQNSNKSNKPRNLDICDDCNIEFKNRPTTKRLDEIKTVNNLMKSAHPQINLNNYIAQSGGMKNRNSSEENSRHKRRNSLENIEESPSCHEKNKKDKQNKRILDKKKQKKNIRKSSSDSRGFTSSDDSYGNSKKNKKNVKDKNKKDDKLKKKDDIKKEFQKRRNNKPTILSQVQCAKFDFGNMKDIQKRACENLISSNRNEQLAVIDVFKHNKEQKYKKSKEESSEISSNNEESKELKLEFKKVEDAKIKKKQNLDIKEYDANIKLPTIEELKAMRNNIKILCNEKDFKGIYDEYLKIRQQRFDYILGRTDLVVGDKVLLDRLRFGVGNNQYLFEDRIKSVLKSKVYVSTQEYYETYKQGEVRDRLKKENGVDVTCAICVSDITMGEVLQKLKCNHYFHCECIETVCLYSNKCPMCRKTAFQ